MATKPGSAPPLDTTARTVEQMKQLLATPLLLAGVHIHAIEWLPDVPCWHVEVRRGPDALRAVMMPRALMLKLNEKVILKTRLKRGLAAHELAMTIVETFDSEARKRALS